MLSVIAGVFKLRQPTMRGRSDRQNQRGFLAFVSGTLGVWRSTLGGRTTEDGLSREVRSGSPSIHPALAPLVAMRGPGATLNVAALTKLLDQHPKARIAFRQLVIVEQTMRLDKTDPFASVPSSILGQATRQLEGLAAPFENPELRVIHEQMCKRAGLKARLAGVERSHWALEPMPVGEVVEPTRPFPLVDMFNGVHAEAPEFAATQPMEERDCPKPR